MHKLQSSKNDGQKLLKVLVVLLLIFISTSIFLYIKLRSSQMLISQNNEHNDIIKTIDSLDDFFIKQQLQNNKIAKSNFDKLKKSNKAVNDASIENNKRAFGAQFDNLQNAIDYIQYFRDDLQKIAKAISFPKDQMVTSVWLDASEINHFEKLILNGGCDGVRVYFAKYKPGENDVTRPIALPAINVDNLYSFVLVATKPDPTGNNHNNYYKQIGNTGVYEGLYDYNKPCKPSCDNGILNDPFPAATP